MNTVFYECIIDPEVIFYAVVYTATFNSDFSQVNLVSNDGYNCSEIYLMIDQ